MTNFILLLAAQLGCTVSEQNCSYKLISDDNDFIVMLTGYYSKNNVCKEITGDDPSVRLSLYGTTPHFSGGQTLTTDNINISSVRGIDTIAKSITKRLLPEAKDIYRQYQQLSLKENAFLNDEREIKAAMTAFAAKFDAYSEYQSPFQQGKDARVLLKELREGISFALKPCEYHQTFDLSIVTPTLTPFVEYIEQKQLKITEISTTYSKNYSILLNGYEDKSDVLALLNIMDVVITDHIKKSSPPLNNKDIHNGRVFDLALGIA
ncbi:hypothetical protein [Photobacterium leiognathi]|uniref:hypothetical protein n=1 Tax=Photobacterium leiognathi TaxID=553611 RepID=UPI0029812106|nr:hypothetical protein [Photobacterium leiognathi]